MALDAAKRGHHTGEQERRACHRGLFRACSEDEARRQLETAIQWGRYAELFDYDAASIILYNHASSHGDNIYTV